jgi:hypothetical protein
MRNKIINGKMEIAQRGVSFTSPADGVYTLDRWLYQRVTTSGNVNITQDADVPSSEFQSSLRVTVTASSTIAAGNYAWLSQKVEGYNARDLIGKTFTIGFWVRSSVTGTYSVSIRNSAVDRTYIGTYTVNVANTWEFKTITVVGGLITAGTWNWTNGIGFDLLFTLCVGSTFANTAGTWQVGNFHGVAAHANVFATNGNIFAITGVQLEVGTAATPFEHRPHGVELAFCQRYFAKTFAPGVAPAQNVGNTTHALGGLGIVSGGYVAALWHFPVAMRSTASIVTYNPTAANAEWTANPGTPIAIVFNAGEKQALIYGHTNTTAGNGYYIHATASAEL